MALFSNILGDTVLSVDGVHLKEVITGAGYAWEREVVDPLLESQQGKELVVNYIKNGSMPIEEYGVIEWDEPDSLYLPTFDEIQDDIRG